MFATGVFPQSAWDCSRCSPAETPCCSRLLLRRHPHLPAAAEPGADSVEIRTLLTCSEFWVSSAGPSHECQQLRLAHTHTHLPSAGRQGHLIYPQVKPCCFHLLTSKGKKKPIKYTFCLKCKKPRTFDILFHWRPWSSACSGWLCRGKICSFSQASISQHWVQVSFGCRVKSSPY